MNALKSVARTQRVKSFLLSDWPSSVRLLVVLCNLNNLTGLQEPSSVRLAVVLSGSFKFVLHSHRQNMLWTSVTSRIS